MGTPSGLVAAMLGFSLGFAAIGYCGDAFAGECEQAQDPDTPEQTQGCNAWRPDADRDERPYGGEESRPHADRANRAYGGERGYGEEDDGTVRHRPGISMGARVMPKGMPSVGVGPSLCFIYGTTRAVSYVVGFCGAVVFSSHTAKAENREFDVGAFNISYMSPYFGVQTRYFYGHINLYIGSRALVAGDSYRDAGMNFEETIANSKSLYGFGFSGGFRLPLVSVVPEDNLPWMLSLGGSLALQAGVSAMLRPAASTTIRVNHVDAWKSETLWTIITPIVDLSLVYTFGDPRVVHK